MLIFHHFSVLGLKHRKKNAYIYIQFYIAGKVWGGVTQDGLRWGGGDKHTFFNAAIDV